MYNTNNSIMDFNNTKTDLYALIVKKRDLLDYNSIVYSDMGKGICTDQYNTFVSNMRVGYNIVKTFFINIATNPNFVIGDNYTNLNP